MIRNQWYAVLDSREVRKGKLTGATRMGEKLAFWRNEDGSVGCLRDKCAHRGVQLSYGKIIRDAVQCPFHGFRYDASGRKVAGQELIGTGVWVPPGLSRGVYFVKVSSKDCSRTLKLIVTK